MFKCRCFHSDTMICRILSFWNPLMSLLLCVSYLSLCVFSRSLGKPIFPCQRVTARWGKLDCPERSCDLEGNIDIMPNRWHGQEIAWTFYPIDDFYNTNWWALEQYQGDKKENSGLRADIAGRPYASVSFGVGLLVVKDMNMSLDICTLSLP